MMKYRQLSAEERAVIVIERRNVRSTRVIADLLGRNASTVSRELNRNCPAQASGYNATQAAIAYLASPPALWPQMQAACGHGAVSEGT